MNQSGLFGSTKQCGSYPLLAMNGIATRSAIELLESRIAPAGLVTVTFTDGVLELTGDEEGQVFSIRALDATTVEIASTDGTLFRMGDDPNVDRLLLTTPIKSLSVDLGAGADTLFLTGLDVKGNIQIDLGEGANALSVDSITTKKNLEIKGGDQLDQVRVIGGVSSVKKDLKLDLGDGDNGFEHVSALLQVGRNFSYTGGANLDEVTLSGSLVVKGNAEFLWGAGANEFETLNAIRIEIGKKLTFDSSSSTVADGDETSIEFSAYATEVRGALKVRDGDGELEFKQQGIALSSRIGSIDVVTGGGKSEIELTSANVGLKSIKIDASESSSSTVELDNYFGGPGVTSAKKFEYIGGDGDDHINAVISGATSGGKAPTFKADLGDGDNQFTFLAINGLVRNVEVTGGSETDNITVSVINGAVGGIKIDSDAGPGNTRFNLVNSKVTGEVKAVTAPTAEGTLFNLAFSNSQIGSLTILSPGKDTTMRFGGEPPEPFSHDFTVKKAMKLDLGDGYNIVDFEGVRNAKVGKGITINMGEGTNDVRGAVENFVTKALTVSSGPGIARVALSGSGNLGKVDLEVGGPGALGNLVSFEGGAIPLVLKSLEVTASGSPLEDLTLSRVQVLGKVNATLGDNSSTVTIENSVFKGPFTLDTGAGGDAVSIDTAMTDTGTVFFKPVTINLGDGNDSLTLGGNDTTALVIAKSKFKADGGAGTNTLSNTGNIFAKEPVFVNLP